MKYVCIVGAENCPEDKEICCYTCSRYGECKSDCKCVTADPEKFENCENIEEGEES